MKNSFKGFGIIEVLISITISLILLTSFTALTTQSIKTARRNAHELKALIYLQELIEISHDLEKSDWAQIISAGCTLADPCYPKNNNGVWALVKNKDDSINTEDNEYTRSLIFSEIRSDTEKAIAKVSWLENEQTRELTLEAYLYNLQ
ncbi:MAG: prepilin-type N-terminal cleavage/methylation domain-containing protein [bacterium]